MSLVDVVSKFISYDVAVKTVKDFECISRFYEYYDGAGQDWIVSRNLDYIPTKKRTNLIKKLIKEEARFLFGKTPEITIIGGVLGQSEAAQKLLSDTFLRNGLSEKLVKAARDAFIGKRVAIKVGLDEKKNVTFSFRNSLEFAFETATGDCDLLENVVFFNKIGGGLAPVEQRFFIQRYFLENGKCILFEGVCDGFGKILETIVDNTFTGYSEIPVKIVYNDGLIGDLFGESDVEPLIELQDAYNRLSSDDIDALKFNMFPQTVAVDAMESSLSNMMIAPGALVDLQTDVAAGENKQASLVKLESGFSYNERLENALDRIKLEMHELLNVPLVSALDIRGGMASGKALRALYWQLVTRCEEKFTTWRASLSWLSRWIILLGKVPEHAEFTYFVDNLYPLIEDEQEEISLDIQKFQAGLMSRKSFVEKWNDGKDFDGINAEVEQIFSESSESAEKKNNVGRIWKWRKLKKLKSSTH